MELFDCVLIGVCAVHVIRSDTHLIRIGHCQ